MPAACIVQDIMQHNTMALGDYDTEANDPSDGKVKQEGVTKLPVGKLVCFFCDKEFTDMCVLHSHQPKCSLFSEVSIPALALPPSDRGVKRSFLSHFNLIPKGKADHLLSTKRKEVVLDVIVIDDDSDDENKVTSKDGSSRYLRSPSVSESKSRQSKNLCFKNQEQNEKLSHGRHTRQASKVFKVDISSPLGMRFRYPNDPKLNKIRTSCFDHFCGATAARTSSNRCYPVTYRKYRQQKCFHKYKFNRRQLREFCRLCKIGLNKKSLRLKRLMKPCRVSLKTLDLGHRNANGTYDAKQYMPPGYSSSNNNEISSVVIEETSSISDKVFENRNTFHRLGNITVMRLQQRGFQLPLHMPTTSLQMSDCSGTSLHINDVQNLSQKACAPLSTVEMNTMVDDRVNVPLSEGKRFKWSAGSSSTVKFIPLSNLCEQFTEVENDDQKDPMFQISSVFSLAGSQHLEQGLLSHLTEGHKKCSEKETSLSDIHESTKNACAKAQEVPSSAETILHSNERETLIQQVKSMAMNSGFIDLTENVTSQSQPSNLSQATGAVRKTVGSSAVPENLMMNRPSVVHSVVQNTVTVSKPAPANSSERRLSQLQKELEKPVVIEIPDEDGVRICIPGNSGRSVQSAGMVTSSPRLPVINHTLMHNRSQNMDSVTVGSSSNDEVRCEETIDLSFDSDCEALDKEPTAQRKRPSLSNSLVPPGKVALEHSQLPALTFKCHICGRLCSFSNNSGAMIKNHYLAHNVTNIELIQHHLPNGQLTWKLIEVEDKPASDPTDSCPTTGSSLPLPSISSPSSNPVRQPPMMAHRNPVLVSSSDSGNPVRQPPMMAQSNPVPVSSDSGNHVRHPPMMAHRNPMPVSSSDNGNPVRQPPMMAHRNPLPVSLSDCGNPVRQPPMMAHHNPVPVSSSDNGNPVRQPPMMAHRNPVPVSSSDSGNPQRQPPMMAHRNPVPVSSRGAVNHSTAQTSYPEMSNTSNVLQMNVNSTSNRRPLALHYVSPTPGNTMTARHTPLRETRVQRINQQSNNDRGNSNRLETVTPMRVHTKHLDSSENIRQFVVEGSGDYENRNVSNVQNNPLSSKNIPSIICLD